MVRVKRSAAKSPLTFVVLALGGWLLAASVFVFVSGLVLQVNFIELLPQALGAVLATLLFILLAGLLGWLRAAGIARLGNWQVWLVAFISTTYLVIAYQLGFFGQIRVDLSLFRYSSQAQTLLIRQLQVAFVEEILFRGILLYVLVRVWGAARRGLFNAALVTALLFGGLHMLQALAGSTSTEAGLTAINCMLSGFWFAALVLMWGSIWPVVLIHAFTNLAIMLPGMVYAPIDPNWWAYIRIILLELPFGIYGIWLIRRMPLRKVVPDVP
jgi:membrane protease YdiL (CAAX protease family)